MTIAERNKAEGDYAAEMVLKIMRYVVDGHKRAVAAGTEPTCLPVYDPAFRDFVNKRSDRRPA